MTADELRELAGYLISRGCSERCDHDAADYLRACADALDAGPVAWTWPNGELLPDDQTDPMWKTGDAVALYPVAMPAPTPPGQQDDEALEVLRELVEARDAYNASETTPQLRDNSTRLRAARKAARALIANRGEK